MARISNYALDTNLSQDDRILGSSYEGMENNKPVYKTRTYKISELSDYFSNNFNIDGVNFNINEIQDYQINLANSLGDPNQDGSLASISINFANDLVSAVSQVPDTFTELALSNISAVPKAFADFLFTIADINEAFANQVLDLASSTAYTTIDTFNTLDAFVTQINSNVQGLSANITSITSAINTISGEISANASELDALGIRVTTAETDVVALETDFTNLSISVNDLTGEVNANATSISTIGVAIDTANTDVAALQADVTLLQTSVNESTGDISAIASDVELLTTNVNTLVADVTAVETSVTTLTTNVNQNTGDIATQATAVSLLANRVDTTEADILNTQTDVTQLTTTVDGATGNIATNASNIAILQTNVSTAQTDITGIITDIQQIETDIDTVSGDITANATAITGLATRVTTAEADVVNVAGNITTLQTDLNTQTGRIDTNVQSINTLGTTVTNNFNTLDASITTVNNARISGDSALSTRIDSIESQITNIPQTIRQDDEPAILDGSNELIYPLGTIWVDTNDNNALYILIEDAGAPSGYAWSPTTSEALGDLILSNAQLETEVNTLTTNLNAEATKLETLTSQFGSYDPATDTFTINNNATVVADLRTYADSESAAASKVDSIGATFGSYDPVTNVFTTSSAKLETIVNALALSNYASTTRVDTLESEIDGNNAAITAEQTARVNEDSALANQITTLTATVSGNTSSISAEETARVNQDEALAQSITTLETSFNGDIGAANARIEAEEIARADQDNALAGQIETLESSFASDIDTVNASILAEQSARTSADSANAAYSLNVASSIGTVDANGTITDVSTSFANAVINAETTGSYATASQLNALSARVGDTEADIEVQQNVTATLEGFAESRYSIQSTAGGVVTGMSILSQSGATEDISQIVFNTQDFKVQNGSGVDQFTIDTEAGQAVFSGILTAGNVDIRNSTITIENPASIIFQNSAEEQTASLFSDAGRFNIVADEQIRIESSTGSIYTGPGGLFVNTSGTIFTNAENYQLAIVSQTGGGYAILGDGTNGFSFGNFATGSLAAPNISVTSSTQFSVTSGGTIFAVRPEGVLINGSPVQTGGTSVNYYLNGITRSGNTLTFEVAGTADVSYTFGANAFTSDALTFSQFQQYEAYSISSTDTDRWNEAHGWGNHASVGYLTAANLPDYLTEVPDAGPGAGTYGSTSNATKIDTIEIDSKGRVVSIATGAVGDISAVTLVANSGSATDGSGVAQLSILGGAGISTSASGTTLTIANTITSNSQLSNGAGYLDQAGVLSVVSAAGYLTASNLPDFITPDELNTELSGYVQTSTLSSYVTTTALNNALADYLPTNSIAAQYVSTSGLSSALSDYVTGTSLSSTLSDYVSTFSLNSTLSDYVTFTDLSTELTNALTGYATETYVDNAVPSGSQISQWNTAYDFSVFGGTVSGNLYANDFILNSDATLKENVVDYTVKPINIQYKEYSFIGTQDKRVGVIAQELEVDHPEFIRESDLGKKSVSYIDLLLAKVAELEARIKQLEDGGTS